MLSTFTVNCCDGSVSISVLPRWGRVKIIGAVLVIIILSMDIALQCLRNLRAPDSTVAAFHQCDGGAV